MPLTLTALQLPARFDRIEEQLALAEALLKEGPPTDLVLLPEASLCGYVSERGNFDLTRFAEPLNGPTREALARLARQFDCLVVGSLVELAPEGLFNCLLGLQPDGRVALHYRKRHPWHPETWATPGAEKAELLSWRGLKLLPAVCFDLHFLETDDVSSLDDADVLLFASAWVDDADSRPALLSSLAARHRLAVLNANWGPGRPRIPGQGGSLFIDQQGQLVARLQTDVGRLDASVP